MATRCRIAYINSDGLIRSVYCHWDGYPGGVGKTLVENFDTDGDAEAIMQGGDISTLDGMKRLAPEPDEEHNFDNPQNDVVLFYGRDRGEANTDACIHGSKDALLSDYVEEYLYVRYKGEWWWTESHYGEYYKNEFRKLKNYNPERVAS